jgi:hypothetical protein
MSSSDRGCETVVYEFSKISRCPVEISSFATFVWYLANSHHQRKAGNKIDRVFMFTEFSCCLRISESSTYASVLLLEEEISEEAVQWS